MHIGSIKKLNFQLEKLGYRTEPAVKIPTENLGKIQEDELFKKAGGGIDEEDFQSFTEGLEDFALEIKNTRFEFSIHEETKRVIVRIYDMNTDELISEIPPEKFLDLIANIWKQVGLIIDKRV